jgi:hypothetical protein
MRGGDERSGALFSDVDLEGRVDKAHPLRTIRLVVNEALAGCRAICRRSTPDWVDRRSRLRSFCERCCCKRSIRSARSGN